MFSVLAHNVITYRADYPVQLDTGSSDLWVKGDTHPLPGSQQTVSHFFGVLF